MACNVMCLMILCGMCTWIYSHRCKITNQTPLIFLKWWHLTVNIYLCSGRYCLMETRKCSLVRSSGGGPFLFVGTYAAVSNGIYSCTSYSMYLLIYPPQWFVGEERASSIFWRSTLGQIPRFPPISALFRYHDRHAYW